MSRRELRTCPAIAGRSAARVAAAVSALFLLALLALLAAPKEAFAQDVAAAANAYARAQKADLAGDHDSAAELYELADSLAPSPEALRSAIRAWRAAGKLNIAAGDAEKILRRYSDDKRSRDLAEQTLDEAKHKLMRLEVHCRPRACNVTVDTAAADAENATDHVVYIEPGDHQVSATFGSDRAEPQSVQGKAADRASLTFDAPAERKPVARVAPSAADDRAVPGGPEREQPVAAGAGGLPPWVFATAAVVTVGLGATTIWSGLDVLQAHNTYEQNKTTAAYDDGKSRELRTNVLVGATIGAGAVTAVLALFTRWSGSGDERAEGVKLGASASASGASFTLGGRF